MMKEEFEEKIGYRVSEAIYDDIEFVYMNDDRFIGPQDMVDFWNARDYGGIWTLKCEIIDRQKKEKAIAEGRAVFKWDRRAGCLRMKEVA